MDKHILRVGIDLRTGEPGNRYERSVQLASVRLDCVLTPGTAESWTEEREAGKQMLIRLGYTTGMEHAEFESRFWDRLMREARRFEKA
jgi:hypothetical protein